MSITEEIQKRRTFAIISHPDAGKTTLTEKLLLYGGAVQLAGSVTVRNHLCTALASNPPPARVSISTTPRLRVWVEN